MQVNTHRWVETDSALQVECVVKHLKELSQEGMKKNQVIKHSTGRIFRAGHDLRTRTWEWDSFDVVYFVSEKL